ncbi:hypothetical protein BCAH1134_C0066 (plasmid) [Bacillus cereus AH1134]|nr:hypothetical protein BCAH1134_C0066 [Bacillus cereus AH1134]
MLKQTIELINKDLILSQWKVIFTSYRELELFLFSMQNLTM